MIIAVNVEYIGVYKSFEIQLNVRSVSSVVEYFVSTINVAGSNPVPVTLVNKFASCC